MLKKIAFFLLAIFAIYLFHLSPPNSLNHWQQIKAKGYLTWVTRPSPLTYYSSLDGIIGLEYDILKSFCDEYNLNLKVITTSTNHELFKLLNNTKIDIAGANFTLTENRKKKYNVSESFDKTNISLISSLAIPKIKSVELLENYKGAVFINSSYAEIAKNLAIKNIQYNNGQSLYELLQQVINGELDYTLADTNIAEIYKSYMPKMRIGLKLSDLSQLVFLLSKQYDSSFQIKINSFINQYKSDGKVSKYKKIITSTLPNSRPADTVNFLVNYKNRWPAVKALVYKTAKKYNINPILLGAVSYQESHWNPTAVSPTLVKGLMMLTKAVAKEQNVIDRNNPLQSLEAGTRYLIEMKGKLPARIIEPNLTNFALAAYNIGYSNLEKARIMAQKDGKDPDLWEHVSEYLIKFNTMKNIKADGKTAVRYVENIHVYQNLLQWKEQQ